MQAETEIPKKNLLYGFAVAIVVDKRRFITRGMEEYDTHSKMEWVSWTRLYDLANNNNNDIDLENKNINRI